MEEETTYRDICSEIMCTSEHFFFHFTFTPLSAFTVHRDYVTENNEKQLVAGEFHQPEL